MKNPKGKRLYDFEKEFGELEEICDGYEKNTKMYIYCIEFNSHLYYIGKSKEVKRRIASHYRNNPKLAKRPPELYQTYDELNMTDVVEIKSFRIEDIDDKERKMFYDMARRFDTKEIYGRR